MVAFGAEKIEENGIRTGWFFRLEAQQELSSSVRVTGPRRFFSDDKVPPVVGEFRAILVTDYVTGLHFTEVKTA
jgi:hypothetical protein